MEGAMHYRLYLLDAKGHIREGRDLDCRNDAEAKRRIRAFNRGAYAAELWQAARRLEHLPGPENTAR
jgi:hypothetical protein